MLMSRLCAILFIVACFLCSYSARRYREFPRSEYTLHEYSKDGDVKQLTYATRAIENNAPLLCFKLGNGKVCVILALNRRPSSLINYESFERLKLYSNKMMTGYSGFQPDRRIVSTMIEKELANHFLLFSQLPFAQNLAKKMELLFASNYQPQHDNNGDDQDEDNEGEEGERSKAKKSFPRRPLAVGSILLHVDEPGMPFYCVYTTGGLSKSNFFTVGKVNQQQRRDFEDKLVAWNSQSSSSDWQLQMKKIIDIFGDEYDCFECLVTLEHDKSVHHIPPCSSSQLLEKWKRIGHFAEIVPVKEKIL